MANITAKVYLREEKPGQLLASTYDGVQDSTDCDVMLFPQPEDKIVVVFENGTPGMTAHVSLYGEELVPQGDRR
jgi:hypothetical protein